MIRLNLILSLLSIFITSFSQDYDAELITHKTSITINNANLTKEISYEIKINNRAGEKYTRISIPYSELITVSNIEAFIKDASGRVVKRLTKSEIITKSSISDFSFYEDNFEKEFILKHNVYPYTVFYSYQIQQKEFFYIDYWIPVIDERVPTLSANLKVSAPISYGISYHGKHIKDTGADTIENRIIYQWTTSYTDIIKPEVYSPAVSDLLPSLAIVPLKFRFEEEGSFENWISYGIWQSKLLQGLNELPDIEKGKILTVVQNITDEKEKIRLLYHYLQDETRYINVKIETGGLKPFPAIYVAQNKYGDCKALTNYFKALLDFIKIPSYYTLIKAGSPINEIDKDFPSQQFNHVILYVPGKDEEIWLDCTSDKAFNYLGSFTQNRDAFVIDYNNSKFLKTPSLKPNDVLATRKIEIKYNYNEAIVNFRNTYRGSSYENIFHLENDFNESEKALIIRNHILSEGFQLVDYQISNTNRDSVKIELSYEATSQNIYSNYGNEILVKNIPFSMPDFEKSQDRKLPVQIDYPIYGIDTVIYQIPTDYKIHKSQDSYNVTNKYGEYKFNIYESEGHIMVIKSLLIFSGLYAISEYEEFYDFYKKVSEIENKTNISLYR